MRLVTGWHMFATTAKLLPADDLQQLKLLKMCKSNENTKYSTNGNEASTPVFFVTKCIFLKHTTTERGVVGT